MEGKLASLLRAFDRDIGRLPREEVAKKLCEIKTHVGAKARSPNGSVGAEKWLAAYALMATKHVRRALHDTSSSDRHAKRHLDEDIFLLEDAVMMSYHVLSAGSQTAPLEASFPDGMSGASPVDTTLLLSAFSRVLAVGAVSSCASSTRALSAAWADCGLLLAVCWLKRDGSTNTYRILQLLDTIVAHWREHGDMQGAIAWVLFLLAMIYAVHQRQEEKALSLMKEAASALKGGGLEDESAAGAIHYWYAVLLSRRGSASVAIDQLRIAVRCNYHVVASLNLQALIALQTRNVFEASEALERGVNIDFDKAVTIFNYATLLHQMDNREAEYQMLEYYREACHSSIDEDDRGEDAHKPKFNGVTRENDSQSMFDERKLSTLCPGSRTTIHSSGVALKMAMAAMACGSWQAARESFEDYFAEEGDRLSELEVIRSFIYVLLQCNRPTEALEWCNKVASAEDVYLAFYKADALLCLERVDDCFELLSNTIQPLIIRSMNERLSKDIKSERQTLHLQLLNNLTIASACRGELQNGIQTLNECMKLYPGNLSVVFNIALLLLRQNRREAACALWFEARGWHFKLVTSLMSDHQKALDAISREEDVALCHVESVPITSHVTDSSRTSGQVSEDQLRYLDVHILNIWSTNQNRDLAKKASQYVEYLEEKSLARK